MFKQGDSQKNFLPENFTAKHELAFVLTQENAYVWRFHFKANRRGISSSKKIPVILKIALRLRHWYIAV